MFARTTVYVQLMRSRWVYRLKRWQQFVLLCLLFQGWSVYLLEYCSKMTNTSHKQFMLLLNDVTQKHLLFLWDIFVTLTDWTVFIQCKCVYHGCASQHLFYLDTFCNWHCKCSVGNLFAPRRELKVFIIPSNSLSFYSWCTQSN